MNSRALAIPEKWTQEIQQYEAQHYNVLAPRELGGVPPYHTPHLSVVQVNPDPEAGDVYALPGGKKFGLSKIALDRISQAAAITWLPELCGRVDDGRDPNIVRYKAVGRIKDLSGQWRTIIGEKEIDLLAIEDELADSLPRREWIKNLAEPKRTAAIKDALDKEMIQFRKHKLARAQSGAMNRAIRSALALRSGYSKEEITRPFVLPKIIFTPDYSDPEVKRFMLAEATGHITELYRQSATLATLPPALPPVPDSETPAELEEEERPALGPAPEEPPNVALGAPLPRPFERVEAFLPAPEDSAPDPDEMRFQAAFEAEQAASTDATKQAAIDAQLAALGSLMARKPYDPSRLKKALTAFGRAERAGFAKHLLALPDAAPKAEAAQSAMPWDHA